MLAQQTLDSVSATYWKNFSISMLVLLGIVLTVATLIWMFRKSDPVKLKDDPAIEVRKSPKRYNHDAIENRFVNVETRLDDHDADIADIKHATEKRQNRLMFALGRIAQKLDVSIELND